MMCPACQRPMVEVDSCVERAGLLTRDGEHTYLITQYASWAEVEWPERCHDCGATRAGFHHPGCCVAICTLHDGEQRLACGCDDHLLGGHRG